jgi:hypothetical protein
MYGVSVTYMSAILAVALAAAALAVWPWARSRRRFVVAGITTFVSWIAWHLLLNATRASGFDVDAPIIRVSWEDVGSGVVTLFATVVVFGLVTERRERASRVVGAASIAGLVALILCFDTGRLRLVWFWQERFSGSTAHTGHATGPGA